MASDLISRAALYDAMREKEWQNWPPLDEIDAVIEKAPAVDDVEVVRCEDCAHCKREGNALRCPYSTVDLEQKGYCSRGIPIAMAAKAPLDEHVKKAITEGEWGDQV